VGRVTHQRLGDFLKRSNPTINVVSPKTQMRRSHRFA
jgi:hypothetical protein